MSPTIKVVINPTRKCAHHGHPSLSNPLRYANKDQPQPQHKDPISNEKNVIQPNCVCVISDATFLTEKYRATNLSFLIASI